MGVWYADSGQFSAYKARGFSHVHQWAQPNSSGTTAWLNAAQAAGLKVCLEVSWAFEGGIYRADRLISVVNPYKTHPALDCWIPYDEMDLAKPAVSEVKKMYDALVALDPVHTLKATMVYPWQSHATVYLPYVKTLGTDPYVIPYGPATQVGTHTGQAVAVAAAKPVCTDIQGFSWGNTFVPPETVTGRRPTVAELVTMGSTAIQAQTYATKCLWVYANSDVVWSGYWNEWPGIIAAWRTAAGLATPTIMDRDGYLSRIPAGISLPGQQPEKRRPSLWTPRMMAPGR